MSDDIWKPDDEDYAIIDWRVHRYLALVWRSTNGSQRAAVARVQDVEERDSEPWITAQDPTARRLLILKPECGELWKLDSPRVSRLGPLELVEAASEDGLAEEYQGIDGYEPDLDADVQSGLQSWGVSP